MNNNIEAIYPLSPMQEGMLYHNLLDSSSSEYVLQNVILADGRLDQVLVKKSLKLLARKHNVLRTAIALTKNTGKMWQIILSDRNIEFNVIHLKTSKVVDNVENLKIQDLCRGFDLQKDSLIRLTLININEGGCYLIWTAHHIIMDGWCLSVLYKDFLNFYVKLKRGINAVEIEKEIDKYHRENNSYEQYIKWLKSQDYNKGLTYWKELLDGYSNEGEIKPIYSLEKPKQSSGCMSISLSKENTQKLVEFSTDNKVTINTIIEAAWGILLQLYNNCPDVVFGKVVSGRNVDLRGIQEMVGLFINTIPVRVTVEEESTGETLLHDLQRQALESMNWDHISLAEVQKNSLMGINLIKTIFVFENYFSDNEGLENELGNMEGLTNIKVLESREQTNYGLAVSASLSDVLHIKILYSDAYSDDEIRMILHRMRMLLMQLVDKPREKILQYEYILPGEKDLLLNKLVQTEYNYDTGLTVVDLFENQVKVCPDNIALRYENKTLTYEKLNRRVNRLARKIRSLGGGPDNIAVLISNRSMEMIIGLLAIIKAGAAYVSIDPDFPDDRIKYIIKDCDAKLILLGGYTLNLKVSLPCIDLMNEVCEEIDDTNPEHVNKPEDLLYVIYTSGTTGKPKGVMIEHKGIVSLQNYFNNKLGVNSSDNILQFANSTFDAFVWEMTMALLSGAALHLVSKDTVNNINMMQQYIDQYISIATLPPQYAAQLKLDSLRMVITAGSEANHKVFEKCNEHQIMINAYGPTETTICATCWIYNKSSLLPKILPIGKPIYNMKVYILRGMNLCPVGVAGELCVSGIGLARGYRNLPELTSDKFVDDPFGDGKLYRTGDLARYDADGNIIYIGRIDEQVKVRGFRIELGEVENAIREIDGIQDAAVIVNKVNEDKVLCAYVVARKDIQRDTIVNELILKLPSYMIPAFITKIHKIPVNKNGKLDKAALPEINVVSSQEYNPPVNDLEKELAEIFQTVLGVKSMGIRDDFFEMGGDSIKAIRIMTLTQDAGYQLTIKDLMQLRTIEKIEQQICLPANQHETETEHEINDDSDSHVKRVHFGISRDDIREALMKYDLNITSSEPEKRYPLLVRQQQFTERPVVLCSKIEIKGNYSLAYVQESIKKVICEQTALRTGYEVHDEKMSEYPMKDDWYIPCYDLTENPEMVKATCENLEKEGVYLNNFKTGGLLSKHVIMRIKSTLYLVYVFTHHLIWDLYSSSIWNDRIRFYLENGDSNVENTIPAYSHFALLREEKKQISEKKYLEFVSVSEKWNELNSDIGKSFVIHQKFEFSDVNRKLVNNPPLAAFHILNKVIMAAFPDVIEYPAFMVYNNRNVKNRNVIGLFADKVPLILSTKEPDNFESIINHINGSNDSVVILSDIDRKLFTGKEEMFAKIPLINVNMNFATQNDEKIYERVNMEWNDHLKENDYVLPINVDMIINEKNIYVTIATVSGNIDKIDSEIREFVMKKEKNHEKHYIRSKGFV